MLLQLACPLIHSTTGYIHHSMITQHRFSRRAQTNNDESVFTDNTTTNSTKVQLEDNSIQFESLDHMLERVRKRQIMNTPLQLQAILNRPILQLGTNKPYLNVGEIALILISVKLGSYGFSSGYIIGKRTLPDIRKSNIVPIFFTELWPGVLAIILDVIYTNIS